MFFTHYRNYFTFQRTSLSFLTLLVGITLGTTVFGGTGKAGISGEAARWSPTSSERLIKLPPNYLKKSIERDFERSSLASALYKNQDNINLKIRTLQDIQASIARTDDEALKRELHHQYLAEKQSYLEMVSNDQQYRRARARTKLKLYEKLLRKIKNKNSGYTPQKAALIKKQQAATDRFNGSVANVDKKLFQSGLLEESRYAREYAKNANAIQRLVQAISNHPMTQQAAPSQEGMTKEDYIRHLIHAAEAKLAILDQEKQVLGYMAKVVALDARALAESLPDMVTREPMENRPLEALEFFIN